MKTLFLLLIGVSTGFCEEGAANFGQREDLSSLFTQTAQLRADVSGAGDSADLFKIVEKEVEKGRVRLLEIKPSQLERNYLFNVTTEKGTGERFVFSTMMEDTFLFAFHWTGKHIQLLRRQTVYRADPDSPEARAVEKSFSDSILATLPIVSVDKNGNIAVPADMIFLTDIINMGSRLQYAYPDPLLRLRLAPEESTIERVQSFPKNMEVRVQLVFTGNPLAQPSEMMADTRKLAVTMRYSLSLLPENNGFTPRPADQRVGYFETTYRDMSHPGLKEVMDPAVSLIHRWNLEKADPDASVSDVKKPVVFWLEDTIPLQYRDAIRAGVLAWNSAFEAIGLRGAVQVKEVDKDMSPKERAVFDPANASYNMIRWFMGEAGFAIGPSRVNPLTGEIFNASISISDIMSRVGMADLDLAAGSQDKTASKPKGEDYQGYAKQLSLGLAALEAEQGPLSDAERKRYYDEYLTHVVAHEVGHTLGLRHNFKGSEMLPQEQLGQDGLVSSSVMDYLAANIAAEGQPQGVFQQTKVGPYDFWAIEYGYKPLSHDVVKSQNELAEIAARAQEDSKLAYGTDEDTEGIDPDAQRFDLGRDQLEFAKQQVTLARNLWKKLESRQSGQGENPSSLRQSYFNGLRGVFSGVNAVLPIVGGIRTSRAFPGGGHEPFEPVSAEEQRAVLKFLDETLFSDKTFQVSPQLLARMGQGRSEGQPTRPVPVDAIALFLQKEALSKLYDPQTLLNMKEAGHMTEDSSGAMSPAEMMDTVSAAIWKEISAEGGVSITPMRQALQREHLKIIVDLNKTEGSARAVAYDEIIRLRQQISSVLASGKVDAAARLHLADMLSRIESSPWFLTAAR